MESYVLMGSVFIWNDEKIMEMDSEDDCTTFINTMTIHNCTHKNG